MIISKLLNDEKSKFQSPNISDMNKLKTETESLRT